MLSPVKSALILLLFSSTATAADVLPAPIKDRDYNPINMQAARLGQLLFYDPILSGNKNIACATCHHPKFATGDGVSLGLGEGGIGLGPERKPDPENLPEQRIPRHAQALFNLGAREFTVLFHDGRIEVDKNRPGGIRSPLDADMMEGFSSLLSAQTMFPVLSADEMAGHYSENEISQSVRLGQITGDGGAWDLVSKRVSGIGEYASGFLAAYPSINSPGDIDFTDISNAIADFIAFEWRSDDSKFDEYLRTGQGLTSLQLEGLDLFNGKANCASCHSGAFQTDHSFHAMGQPQFGPGKAARFETHKRDIGRMRVTGKIEDQYAFRTPSLRNVADTAPYGHTGAYPDLRTFLMAHTDPGNSIFNYDTKLATLPDFQTDDWVILSDTDELTEIAAMVKTPPTDLTDDEVTALIAFLKALSDEAAVNGRMGIPETVPSRLPVER